MLDVKTCTAVSTFIHPKVDQLTVQSEIKQYQHNALNLVHLAYLPSTYRILHIDRRLLHCDQFLATKTVTFHTFTAALKVFNFGDVLTVYILRVAATRQLNINLPPYQLT
jgi:hypothetical protein